MYVINISKNKKKYQKKTSIHCLTIISPALPQKKEGNFDSKLALTTIRFQI